MRRISVLAAAAALRGTVQTVSAQTPQFALEVRGGYAIPTGDWNEDDTFENGFGFGANVMAMVTPQIGVYAGWETFEFKVDEDEEGVEADATDAGFRAGVTVNVPLAQSPNLTPFVELGVLYNTLEISASAGGASIDVESDASLGFEAGLGVAVALGQRLSVVPMVRYRRHEVEFEDFSDESDTIEYVVVGIGLRLRL
ncbi:MAG: porin family protein [Gemmatimonadetes bacterium]|nr:porin family protein [Gemmatimonadota bacterium]